MSRRRGKRVLQVPTASVIHRDLPKYQQEGEWGCKHSSGEECNRCKAEQERQYAPENRDSAVQEQGQKPNGFRIFRRT